MLREDFDVDAICIKMRIGILSTWERLHGKISISPWLNIFYPSPPPRVTKSHIKLTCFSMAIHTHATDPSLRPDFPCMDRYNLQRQLYALIGASCVGDGWSIEAAALSV